MQPVVTVLDRAALEVKLHFPSDTQRSNVILNFMNKEQDFLGTNNVLLHRGQT